MSNEAPVETMPVVSRFFFAITCFIMVVFDGVFAADVDRTRRLLPPRSNQPKSAPKADETQPGKAKLAATSAAAASTADSASSDAVEDSASGVDSTLKHRSPPKPKSVPPPAAPSDAVETTSAPSTSKTAESDAEKFAPRERGALLLLSLLQRDGRFVDFLQQDVTTFDDAQVGAAARVVHDGCRRALKSHLTIEPIQTEAEGDTLTLNAGYDVQAIKLVGNVSGKPPYKGSVQHRGWRAANIELPKEVGAHDPSVLAQAEIEL